MVDPSIAEAQNSRCSPEALEDWMDLYMIRCSGMENPWKLVSRGSGSTG